MISVLTNVLLGLGLFFLGTVCIGLSCSLMFALATGLTEVALRFGERLKKIGESK